MTVNFNPAAKTNQLKNTQVKKQSAGVTNPQEKKQVSWEQALPGSNVYTGQPINIKKPTSDLKMGKSYEVTVNGFLVRSKDGSPVKYETVEIQEAGKTLYKIVGDNLEVYATPGEDKIIVEGEGNSIYGGSERDKFYVKGNNNEIHSDSYNWRLRKDGKIERREIEVQGQYGTRKTASDRIFVFGENNTIISSDDTIKDTICTYEPGNSHNSNKLDKQLNAKDNFYRFNDNYNPEEPVAVVYDLFDGSGSHGNAVRNTLVKGGYDRNYNSDAQVKTFDFDASENKWKTNFIDETKYPEAKAKLNELNKMQFEDPKTRFTKGLEILEQENIHIDVVNHSMAPNFFNGTGEYNKDMKFTYREYSDLLGGGVNINAHNIDKYSKAIVLAADEKLKTETDPAEIKKITDLRDYAQNKPKIYATYKDLSNLINEHRDPEAPQVTITEKNIDHYRSELVEILEEDSQKPENERKTSWAKIQYIRNITEGQKYPLMNAAGNERSGVDLSALTDETITVSGVTRQPGFSPTETQDVHQSSLVDAREFVQVGHDRGTSISAPLHSRRYIDTKIELYKEMQQAQNAYFK